jgi:hypothetical protein
VPRPRTNERLPHMPDPNALPLFRCSGCFALYHVTAQAVSHAVDLKVTCQVCNEPLVAREGKLVLKYFLLRKASPLDVRRARQGFLRTKPPARRKKASVPIGESPDHEVVASCSQKSRGWGFRRPAYGHDQPVVRTPPLSVAIRRVAERGPSRVRQRASATPCSRLGAGAG